MLFLFGKCRIHEDSRFPICKLILPGTAPLNCSAPVQLLLLTKSAFEFLYFWNHLCRLSEFWSLKVTAKKSALCVITWCLVLRALCSISKKTIWRCVFEHSVCDFMIVVVMLNIYAFANIKNSKKKRTTFWILQKESESY